MKELYGAIVDAAETTGISTDCALLFLDELGLFSEKRMKHLEVEVDRVLQREQEAITEDEIARKEAMVENPPRDTDRYAH